ncbi:MAG: ATP synthase F1 subunit epsilon [Clostridia bacterium]|nr:ATP synthase F1 subunit epsilon [Clostridia bacterium]
MNKFRLQIVTPDGIEYDGEAESLLVHTVTGDMEILAGHMEMAAAVGTGRVRILTGEGKLFASASGGFLTVSRGEVKLVCVTFELREDIDLARAEASRLRAEEKIKNAKDDRALAAAKAKLARAINRIKVAEMK